MQSVLSDAEIRSFKVQPVQSVLSDAEMRRFGVSKLIAGENKKRDAHGGSMMRWREKSAALQRSVAGVIPEAGSAEWRAKIAELAKGSHQSMYHKDFPGNYEAYSPSSPAKSSKDKNASQVPIGFSGFVPSSDQLRADERMAAERRRLEEYAAHVQQNKERLQNKEHLQHNELSRKQGPGVEPPPPFEPNATTFHQQFIINPRKHFTTDYREGLSQKDVHTTDNGARLGNDRVRERRGLADCAKRDRSTCARYAAMV